MKNRNGITCNSCGAQFDGNAHGESTTFDQHSCPAIPQPMKGETFEDYQARCAVSIAEWMEKA